MCSKECYNIYKRKKKWVEKRNCEYEKTKKRKERKSGLGNYIMQEVTIVLSFV